MSITLVETSSNCGGRVNPAAQKAAHSRQQRNLTPKLTPSHAIDVVKWSWGIVGIALS